MKAYYYFLFRVYKYYKDKHNENEFHALFSTTIVGTLIIYFVLLHIYGIANYFNQLPMVINKMHVIPIMIVIGFINYFYFVRKKKFLNYNFQKDIKGGRYIIIFIISLAISFVILANINREKIFEERRKKTPVERTEKRPSLEGKIRKWFEDTF